MQAVAKSCKMFIYRIYYFWTLQAKALKSTLLVAYQVDSKITTIHLK